MQHIVQKRRLISSSFLIDSYSRMHDYLRISLSERCNLRCHYCMPEDGVQLTANDKLLNADEIVQIAAVFAEGGVKKVRLTGGEPTLRSDILDITRRISEIPGIEKVAMTTNGIILNRMVKKLKENGLTQINVSLDTLVPGKFQFITRRLGFEKVMEGINGALTQGFESVKINCVVMKNFNFDEILDFVELTKDKDVIVRFIEHMPFPGGNWKREQTFVSYKEMLDVIKSKYPDFTRLSHIDTHTDTTKHYKVPGYIGSVGFISSMSDHFCHTCSRLRLTADGNLKVCLFGDKEVSLRDILRNNIDKPIEVRKQLLREVIGIALKKKKAKHAGMENINNDLSNNRPMILIGG